MKPSLPVITPDTDACADCPTANCYGCTALVHEHKWSWWYSLAVTRDSFGKVIESAGVSIRRLSPVDEPATSGWWRTCLACPAEERA